MKLTAFILIGFCLQVSASGFSQTITYSATNAPLKKIFSEIKKQAGYVVVGNYALIESASPVTIHAVNQPLVDFIKEVLKDQAFSYTIKNTTISIREKKNSSADLNLSANTGEMFLPITGFVRNMDGQPLGGVNIMIKGTKTGTTTDDEGRFSLNAEAGNVLIISYIGFQSKEITVRDAGTVNILLEKAVVNMDTTTVIVNTGYQKISAERVTGAFDNVNKNQLQKPTKNIAERLIGVVAGMQINTDINGNPTIQVRGQTTLSANNLGAGNTPLIVVDGFAVRGTAFNPFGTINPNDVESITVLKDAAAASIWGARSANGVIVITTKRGGKESPLEIDFSANTRFAKKADVGYMTGLAGPVETVDFEQFAFNKWGAFPNNGTISNNYKMSSASTLMNEHYLGYLTIDQLNAGLAQLKTQDNRSQISDYLMANPLTNQYNLSLSGGGKRMNNYVSFLAEKYQSNFKGSDNKKYAVNYRTNAQVFKWLDFDLSGTFQLIKSNGNGAQLYDIQQLSPYQLLKNPDGSFTNISQYYQPTMDRLVPMAKFPYSFNYNPIQDMENKSSVNNDIQARLQAGLTFKLLPGLTFNSKAQYQNVRIETRTYNNDQTFAVRNRVNTTSTWNQTPTGSVTRNMPLGGSLEQSYSTTEIYNFRNQLNFSRKFAGKHEINVVAGTEINNATAKTSTPSVTYGYDDVTLAVGAFPNGLTGTTGWQGNSNNFVAYNSFGYSTQRFYSLYANAAYTFLDKYTLSGSYRTDASNLIASDPKYRYSPFYSAGISYEITKEKFMQDVSWLDRLNIRATYGRTGNVDNSTSPFTLLTLDGTDRYTNLPVGRISGKGNPTLTWEKTSTLNLGLDYAVLGNKLYGKIDVYQKKGTDLLAQISTPSVTGSTFSQFNNAALLNKGIELTLGTSIPLKGNDIVWNGNFSGAYNKGEITKLINSTYQSSALVRGGNQAYSEGYDPSTAWAYQYAGLVNGEPKIVGPNGTFLPMNNSLTDDGRSFLQNMGTTNPRYILGFTSAFKIYDFNISFILTAKLGAVFNSQAFNYPLSGYSVLPNSQLASVLNGDPNKILTLPTNANDASYSGWIRTYPYLNYNYLSANLVRLQEVNISYNLPGFLLSKLKLQGVQLIAQGNNLYTWLANDKGEDPEYRLGNLRPRAQYTLGVNIKL